MSYHIYTTSALIISSSPRGEADLIYKIYCKELGMIQAVATGIRKQHSKLSAHLQDFRIIDVSLVAGKDIWRITNAKSDEYFSDVFANIQARKIYSRIILLISRLVNGEERHVELFQTLIDGIKSISEFIRKGAFEEVADSIETILVIRILNLLGYIKIGENNRELLDNTNKITDEMCKNVKKNMKSLILEINRAIRESQL